jgi:hypothetical protein
MKKSSKPEKFSGQDESEMANNKNKLSGFLQKRPTAESLQKSGILVTDKLLFGGRVENHWADSGNKIPRIILECIDAVERKGLQAVGIYRLSGNAADIQKLRYIYNQNEPVNVVTDPRWADINVVTGVLKLYFRELQEPLIPYRLFDLFVEGCRIENINQRVMSLKQTLTRMPIPNLEILKYLIKHLVRVAQYNYVNKMEASALAIVFGPTLMKPERETMDMMMNMGIQNALIELFILHHEHFFP